MSYRIAIYFAPDATGPLWRQAAQWLGRDPLSGATHADDIGGIARAEIEGKSASARRYGFHATIKPPMRLADGKSEAELAAALRAFGAAHGPVAIGRLTLARIDGFLALVPAEQPQALTDFAAEVVTAFEPLRAPVSAAEQARRNAGGRLSARQLELLERYGYPYVMEQFQFHMTLTDRLAPADQERFEAALRAHFGALAEAEAVLDRLSLYREAEPGAPFSRGEDFLLEGTGR
jgi:putative phosphonate metabolism protein